MIVMRIELKDYGDGCVNLFVRESTEEQRTQIKGWLKPYGVNKVMVGRMSDPMIITFVKEEKIWESFLGTFSQDEGQRATVKNTRVVL